MTPARPSLRRRRRSAPRPTPSSRRSWSSSRTIAEEAEDAGIGEADTRDRRKVLVFSYFADTVDWIVDHLTEVVDNGSEARRVLGSASPQRRGAGTGRRRRCAASPPDDRRAARARTTIGSTSS